MGTPLAIAPQLGDRRLEPCQAVAVTLRIRGDRPVFRHAVFARYCVDFLRALGTMTGTRVHAYCLVPDRVHLLLGPPPATSVARFIGRWMELCAREWERRRGQTPLWQPGAELRPIVDSEMLHRACAHILDTPAAAGPVGRRDGCRLAGSFESVSTSTTCRRTC